MSRGFVNPAGAYVHHPIRVSLSEWEARTRAYIGRWSSRDIAFDNESQFRFEPLEAALCERRKAVSQHDRSSLTADHEG